MYKSCIGIKLHNESDRNHLSKLIRSELTEPAYSHYSDIYDTLKIIKPRENMMTFLICPHIFALSALNRMLMDLCSANPHLIEFVQLSQFPLQGWANSPIAGLGDGPLKHGVTDTYFGSDRAC
jgi:hypothetical protein